MFIVDILVELFGELLLQIVGELIVNVGWRSVAGLFQRRPHPIVAAIGYAAFGAATGYLSIWLMPALLISSHPLRIVNLVITPLLSGAAMAAIGHWRRRRDLTVIGLDRFMYGYLFALAMAIVRFKVGD